MKKEKKTKLKENPAVKDLKKIKITNMSEDENEIKSFIIIVVIIAILVGLIYGLTEIFKKDETSTNNELVTGVVDYDKVSVGTLLNRPYDNYYVMIYNSDASNAVLYSTILTKYMQKSTEDNYIKIYYCDLNNSLNSKYYDINEDGISNPKAQNVEEFNFGDLTLIKVEKGKITKYIEDYEKIKDILK